MKRHATTIVLVLVAVVLGVYLYVGRDRITAGERARREDSVFPAWRRQELTRVEITGRDGAIVLERDPDDEASWRMRSPRDEPADEAAVERLLTTLEFATVVREVASGAATGLEAPRATGSIRMGGLAYRFAVGGPAPRPEGAAYFSLDGAPPVVIAREAADALLAPAETYRDRTVVPYLSLDLARMDVKHPGGGFTLERIDARRFRVASEGVSASRDALDGVWSALASMRAESFPKDADAERLTANPRLSITMTPKDASKPKAELVVGDACPGHPEDLVVLRKAPTRVAACAPAGGLEALRSAPRDLIDEHPFWLHADEIEELSLEWLGGDAGAGPSSLGRGEGAPDRIAIARKGTGFFGRAPLHRDLSPGEADAASALLERIAESEAVSVAEAGAPFVAVARARARSGDREEVVEIGAPDAEGHVIVQRDADGARLEADLAFARRLVPRSTTLRPREPFGDTRRVSRVVLRCGTPQELADEGHGFRFVEPEGYEADGAVVQLVNAVVRGKVDAWVSDVATPAFGVDASSGCRVVVAFADDKAPATLVLGAEGEGGIYGTASGKDGVFVAPKSLRELAQRIYVSRSLTRVPRSRIESVRVTHRGVPVTEIPRAQLEDAASALYADRVIAIGPEARAAAVRADVVIDVAPAEGGAHKRVTCSEEPIAGDPAHRACKVGGVSATFAVAVDALERFVTPADDAGAQDGG